MTTKSTLISSLVLYNLLMINNAFGQTAGQCIDSDGDGYGWNGVETCAPSNNVEDPLLTNISRAHVSADGRFVVYDTTTGEGRNDRPDKVWLHDRNANTTIPLKTDAAGNELVTESGVLSSDGRYAAFVGSSDLAGQNIYIYDISNKQTTSLLASNLNDNSISGVLISNDGSIVAYQDVGYSQNSFINTIHVINRLTGESTVASVDEFGNPLDAGSRQGVAMQALSGNGRYLFTRKFINLQTTSITRIYQFDLETGVATQILNSASEVLALTSSADGKTIAFYSGDNTLVPNDTSGEFAPSLGYTIRSEDVFVHELNTGLITRISVDSDGNQTTDGPNFSTRISADGRYVSFVSYTNLDPSAGDCDYINCDYLHDRNTGTTSRLNNLSGINITENGTVVQYDGNSVDAYSFTIPATAQCVDSDGDGYGWNGIDTCTVTPTTPIVNSSCDYSDADLYGGWGWNATEQQSCAPVEPNNLQPASAQCVDSDGDGYGWNGIATCDPDNS